MKANSLYRVREVSMVEDHPKRSFVIPIWISLLRTRRKRCFGNAVVTAASEAFSHSKECCARHNLLKFFEEEFSRAGKEASSWFLHLPTGQGRPRVTHRKWWKNSWQRRMYRLHGWPGNSPDVNSIENLWVILQKLTSCCKLYDCEKAHSRTDSNMVHGSENCQWLLKTSRLHAKPRWKGGLKNPC